MAMVMVASVKGAPGVTTASLGLAAAWRRNAILAEFDPDGGDVRYRLNGSDGEPLTPDPSLVGLAKAVSDAPDVRDYLQELHGGIEVLVGLPSAAAALALDDRWAAVGALVAATPNRDVIADCGRLQPSGPGELLFAHASALLFLTRPTVDGVAHLRARLEVLDNAPPTFVAVVTGAADSRSPRQVQAILDEARLGVQVLGRIAYDSVAAGTLAGAWSSRLSRSWLIRSCGEISSRLLKELDRQHVDETVPA